MLIESPVAGLTQIRGRRAGVLATAEDMRRDTTAKSNTRRPQVAVIAKCFPLICGELASKPDFMLARARRGGMKVI